jgi:hypothetical protein
MKNRDRATRYAVGKNVTRDAADAEPQQIKG